MRTKLQTRKRLVVRGWWRVLEGCLAQVVAHLAFITRQGRKEAVASGVGVELKDDAVGSRKATVDRLACTSAWC